jgi:hypothetical protein
MAGKSSDLRQFKKDVKRLMDLMGKRGWNRGYSLHLCMTVTKLLEATLGVKDESQQSGPSDNQIEG